MLAALGISRIDNKSGMTLLEVLVSLGILSVVVAGMTSFMLSSTREVRALTETLAKLDTEKLLIASLADGAACSAELANPAIWTAGAQPYTIDTTNTATMLNTSINLPSIHAAASATAPFGTVVIVFLILIGLGCRIEPVNETVSSAI